MTRTPAVMEIENAISGLRLCVEEHRAGEELSGYRVSHCDVPVRSLETVLDAVTRTPSEPTEMVDQQIVEAGQRFLYGLDHKFGCNEEGRFDEAVERADILGFAAAISAYNPNERLREALVALADAADKCTEAPHFIVQPFLNVYRKHGETIAEARAAPSHEE